MLVKAMTKNSTLQKSTPKHTEEDQLLVAEQVGQMLQKSAGAVWRMAQRGQLPHIRLGRSVRFERKKILEYLENLEAVTTEEALLEMNRKRR